MRRCCEVIQLKPVGFQVKPPSVDFNTPIECVSPASRSPVAMYIMFGLIELMAMSETPQEPS